MQKALFGKALAKVIEQAAGVPVPIINWPPLLLLPLVTNGDAPQPERLGDEAGLIR